ncbi:4-coumarate--CoA ligase 2-like [Aricia agestis]|uniref:4-coumarate--CoA ligase 2-like n=1 Tax=Aricia agestis TaxID=91739 RepID=UPI001C20A86B|nr:4-coumarate--CoA ligase 2-like [Aricia agestis]
MFKSVQILERRVFGLSRRYLWTSEKIIQSPFKDVEIPDTTLTEYMWKDLGKWANKTAMICGVSERQYTFLQLYRRSKIFGANLRKRFKIEDDDVIAVMAPNIPEYGIIALGILEAGAVITPYNYLFTPYEIQKLLPLANPKMIITIPECEPVVRKGIEMANKDIPIIAVDFGQSRPDNTLSFKELMSDKVDMTVLKDVKRTSNDVAALLYSSGTTGLPKAVELTHRNIIANSEQQSTECRRHVETTKRHQDTALAILPFSHVSGLGINMFHKLSNGVRLVTVKKFQPDTFVKVLDNFHFNIFTLTTPIVQFLGSYPKVTAKHLEHLRYAGTGGAPIPKRDIEKFLDKAHNVHLGQIYGLTETSPVVTLNPIGSKKYTSAGFAVPNVSLRVVDTEMNNLGPNEQGELLIKGPNVMKGYKNNPEANARAFVDNEWLRSGDLVSIDNDGAMYVADRLRDLIKVKGFQVAPAELESIIKEIPKVEDVAVVGIEDARTGERPKAFIVINDKNVKEMEVLNYVNLKVAPYKHLKEVIFVNEIPKNPTGKILKRDLLEKYCK